MKKLKYAPKNWKQHGSDRFESNFGVVSRVKNKWLAVLKVYQSETPEKLDSFQLTSSSISGNHRTSKDAMRAVERAADYYVDQISLNGETKYMILLPKDIMKRKVLKYRELQQKLEEHRKAYEEHIHETTDVHSCSGDCEKK